MKKLLFLVVYFIFAVSVNAQSSIQKVDFKNFTYNLSCGDADKKSSVTVKNGGYDGIKNSFEADDVQVHLNIYKVIYGDLDGDKQDEAVVLYSCGSGASYVYFRDLIFKMKKRKPIMVTELEGGNKGDGGFKKVRFLRRKLIVERYQLPPASGSACCPAFIETTRYKLKGKTLLQVGKRISRKIPNSD